MDAIAEAEALKREGNAHFQRKEFREAVAVYSSALERLQSAASGDAQQQLEAALRLNRAWAVLEVHGSAREDILMAESDCSEVLRKDGGCVKALYRRALARERLGNVLGAMKDTQCMKALEPANPSIEPLLLRLRSMEAGALKALHAFSEPTDSLTTKMDRISIVETPHDISKGVNTLLHARASKEEADAAWRALQEEESSLRRTFKPAARKRPSKTTASAANRINANVFAQPVHGEISKKTDAMWALLGEEEASTMAKAFPQSKKTSRTAVSR